MIIDTHLHLIDKSALRYPWLSSTPALDRDFLYGTYAQEARRAGIGAALHMEVDVEPADMEKETGEIKRLSEMPGSLLKGAIAAGRPENTDFPEYLERQQANPFVKGFRRVLHVVPDDVSEGAAFRENIKRLGGSRFTFDLCVLPHQIPKAIALADLAPDVRFILDHCGVPGIKEGQDHPWRGHMSEIARRPNVTAKISGVIAYADAESWDVETLRPYVEHTIGAFDWDRVVWGSDWPVCTLGGTLSTWVAATHALIAGCSLEERTKLLSGNARRIWGL
ncbi:MULTISPECIES: amidohydrolase [unclassified Rhizobium]|uniref:amidohydrolase family protein n=1 Tax=unclassified Rhizobium TaxID=2613769 RepID=UPI0006FA6561|nr:MULTISPECIES: amidohydrolase [unclassified Rhizobium]KQV37532.1 amidohydrolase [Rhizobium sp. Root1212]KRD30321.1 amidohydrolase [Rhizobium sp. Root268]